MTSTLKKAATMTAAATILAAGFAAHAPAADIRAGLMLKKGFPGAEPVNGMFELFESEVEKGSSGAIEMEIVYGGALGKPNERLNHVRHGIIQMSDASDGNYASIYKDIQILSMPYVSRRDGREHVIHGRLPRRYTGPRRRGTPRPSLTAQRCNEGKPTAQPFNHFVRGPPTHPIAERRRRGKRAAAISR